MTDGLLAEIILLEKKLQADLAAEEERCRVWRDRELALLDQELAAARQATDRSGEASSEQARSVAREEAAALLRRTKRWCQCLEGLKDADVRDSLSRHLRGVLPEASRDHPHGES
ncbi:MAG: hypothetical protein RQ723_00780 [Desulfuromonadales bacterium]|nr:hypothetical protein [Desulfuromonadales bacterium]